MYCLAPETYSFLGADSLVKNIPNVPNSTVYHVDIFKVLLNCYGSNYTGPGSNPLEGMAGGHFDLTMLHQVIKRSTIPALWLWHFKILNGFLVKILPWKMLLGVSSIFCKKNLNWFWSWKKQLDQTSKSIFQLISRNTYLDINN